MSPFAARGSAPPDELASSPALAAIERERYRSYSDLVRNLHWLAATLVVLHVVADRLPGRSTERGALLALAGLLVLYTLALHSPLLQRVRIGRRIAVESAVDLLWTTAVVALSGAAASPLFFLYFTVLFATTPAATRGASYARAAAASALILLVPAVASLLHGDFGGAAARALDPASLRPLLWPLAGLWLVAYFTAEASSLGASLHRSLFVEAHTDALTGLPNLRHFNAAADLRGRLGEPYVIVIVDADGLKRINDTHGHARGSELIRSVGAALRQAARGGDDLVSRLGGDEFIVRLAGAVAEGGEAYCARVRQHLAEHPLALDGGAVLPITVSMGIAAFPADGRSLSAVTEAADQALYHAKRDGRGRGLTVLPAAAPREHTG